MKSHLQVKVFSMAAEMHYIHKNENKWKDRARIARQKVRAFYTASENERFNNSLSYAENAFWSMRKHRLGMKAEARVTHLAYGFMKRLGYSEMEYICYGQIKGYGSSEPDWKAIEVMVNRFSKDETNPQDWMQSFTRWLEDAKEWYDGNKQRIEAFNRGRPERLKALKLLKKPYVRPEPMEKT